MRVSRRPTGESCTAPRRGVLDSSAALAHRVAAADASDDALANELEEAANRGEEASGTVTKARYLEWASVLSSGRDQRERRLLSATRCLLADRRISSAAKLRGKSRRAPTLAFAAWSWACWNGRTGTGEPPSSCS